MGIGKKSLGLEKKFTDTILLYHGRRVSFLFFLFPPCVKRPYSLLFLLGHPTSITLKTSFRRPFFRVNFFSPFTLSRKILLLA